MVAFLSREREAEGTGSLFTMSDPLCERPRKPTDISLMCSDIQARQEAATSPASHRDCYRILPSILPEELLLRN